MAADALVETGTDSTSLSWSVPECPFTIESSTRVLDDIRLSVMDAFFSLPRGGAEIGGILLGTFDSGRLVISGYTALDCEHAHGPSFTLSPPDEARLTALLSAHTNKAGGQRPVGWYHSHTRSEIFLTDADLEIYQRFFPEAWQVALVMKPHTFQPARIGYFFREPDGAVHSSAPYREDVLAALPIRQMPSGTPTMPPAWQMPLVARAAPPVNSAAQERFRPGPVAALQPVQEFAPQPVQEFAPQPVQDFALRTVQDLAPAVLPPAIIPAISETVIPVAEPAEPAALDLPLPKFAIESASSARRWMVVGIGIVAILGVLGAGFQTRQLWLPRVLAALRPVLPAAPPPALGLSTIDREGQLQINWDRNSPAVQRSGDGVLEITGGGPLPLAIPLDAAHLQAGSFHYARTSEKVDVKLIVHQKNGPDVREVTSFLGKLPERKPGEDADSQTQREDLAKEAAKLKADLSFQAAKTRKLEKDVQAMRDEMRQQQQRRLTNQLPDK